MIMVNHEGNKAAVPRDRVIMAGIAFIVLFWVVDSYIDAYFDHINIARELFAPDLHEILIRLTVSLALLLLVAYILRVLATKAKLEAALETAVLTAETAKLSSEAILESTGDAVSIQDTEFRVLFQNKIHREMMGDHAGEFCYAAYRGREEICSDCNLAKSFQDGLIYREEHYWGREKEQYMEIIHAPLHDTTGTIIAGIETYRDITPRKQLENLLGKKLAAIESSMDGIAILDDQSLYTYLNPAHARVYGYDSPADLVGKSWRIHYHPEKMVWFEQEVLPVLQETGRWRGESTGLRRDGSTYPQELSLNLLGDGGMICVVRDISERKQAEAIIVEQAQMLQRLIDTIPNPIFYIDERHLFLGCNKAFEADFGFSREEAVGRPIPKLEPKELFRTFLEGAENLLETQGVHVFEEAVPYRGGITHDVIISRATFVDADGRPAGLVGVVNDISPRKRAEAEIRKLNANLLERTVELSAINNELEAFNYSLSHDLRNYLTRLAICSQALDEDYGEKLDENGRVFTKGLRQGVEHMDELIEAMLSMARVSRRELRRTTVDLSGLAREIAVDLRLGEPGRSVEFVIAEGITAEGDPELLRVVMENLLGNAWKYTMHSSPSRIEFGVTEQENRQVVFVRDNGVGISMTDTERIFKPFERLHASSEFPGTGIGLATVSRIIERHHGRIWCEGEAGRGATFYFFVK
jgi:PAS domain S-box-containing protein